MEKSPQKTKRIVYLLMVTFMIVQLFMPFFSSGTAVQADSEDEQLIVQTDEIQMNDNQDDKGEEIDTSEPNLEIKDMDQTVEEQLNLPEETDDPIKNKGDPEIDTKKEQSRPTLAPYAAVMAVGAEENPTEPVGNFELFVYKGEQEPQINPTEDVDVSQLTSLEGGFFVLTAEDGTRHQIFPDETGHALLNDLPVGTYTFDQRAASNDYQVHPSLRYGKGIQIEITEGATTKVIVYNSLAPGDLVITKYEGAKDPEVDLHFVGGGSGRSAQPKGNSMSASTSTNSPQKLVGAEFKLIPADNDGTYNETIAPFASPIVINEYGFGDLANIPAGKYYLVETKAPRGYVLNSNPIKVEIKSNRYYYTSVKVYNEPLTTGRILVTKTEGKNEPEVINPEVLDPPYVENTTPLPPVLMVANEAGESTILKGATFQLTGPDNYAQELSTDDQGTILFENLPFGEYTLIETKAPEGYQLDETPIIINVENYGEVQVNVQNKKIEQTDISVRKEWKLFNKEKQDVTIKLFANNEVVNETTLNANNNWEHTFKGMPLKQNGTNIKYQIEEVTIDGFDSVVTGGATNGFVVTNTEVVPPADLTPATTDIAVQKEWKGSPTDEITVHLLADGQIVDTVVLSAATDWQHVFKDMPVVHNVSDEQAIMYTVAEDEIKGYDTTITGNSKDGFIITNTEIVPPADLTPATTDITVQKEWKGTPTEEITVHLLADGQIVDTVILNAATDWQHVFKDMPVVHNVSDEQAIVYTVAEDEVKGYDTTITGNSKDGFVITNTKKMDTNEVTPNTKPKKMNKTTSNSKLPQTGETTSLVMLIAFSLIVMGALFQIKFKENE